MARRTINRENAAKEGGDSKYINSGGIYLVNLLGVERSPSKKSKSVGVNFIVDYNGIPQTIYNVAWITGKEGKPLEAKIMDKLAVLLDIDGWDDEETEVAEFPVGPKKAIKEVEIFTSFPESTIQLEVQIRPSIYNGDIKESTVVRSIFRGDGASVAEIEAGVNIGEQLAKNKAYLDENPVNFKEVSQEDYEAWIKAKRPKGTASSAPTTTRPAGKSRFQK